MPRISTALTWADRLGSWKARWGIGRMGYLVPPGLYAIGSPSHDSPVLVTANYKMSYDIVRRVLGGRSCWLLVLETYGINVWCAAGKGTFGTEELIRRIKVSELDTVVSHRRLILPVLGAPGVAAHEVAKQTGFSIRFAGIRAGDLPEYLDNGMVTTPAMQELTFTTWERMVLIPVELVEAIKPTAIVAALVFAILTALQGYTIGLKAVYAYLGAVLAGTAITPILLPWLPSRSFAFKGVLVGLGWGMIFYFIDGGNEWRTSMIIATFMTLPAISAFYALNFTGCTPFTSRSGVKKEMRIALPAMAGALLAGALVAIMGIIG
ncbi:MAG: mercury methylation corrinoid protein HgcA [Dehalococcoidales bacterium]|nr:mercury methylation corrinoid protein HgcA [Dehalococcoidales bacterium]